MDCPNDVARRAASIMFSKAAEETTRADLQDAIAELLNMIGGNFKALLPGQCFLSLPAVVEGGDYSARVPGSTVFGKIAFGCENDIVSVVILEKVSRKVAASSEIQGSLMRDV